MRLIVAIISIFFILVSSCTLSNRYEIQFDCDNSTIETGGATIAVVETGNNMTARMSNRDGNVILTWNLDGISPGDWAGERFRGTHIEIKRQQYNWEYSGNKVGILIEVTDVTGRTVSGKFSGLVGFGDNAHKIDNGVFRAYIKTE